MNLELIEKVKADAQAAANATAQRKAEEIAAERRVRAAYAREIFDQYYTGLIAEAFGAPATDPMLISGNPEDRKQVATAEAFAFVPGHAPVGIVCTRGAEIWIPKPTKENPNLRERGGYDLNKGTCEVVVHSYLREKTAGAYGRVQPPCWGRDAGYTHSAYHTDNLAYALSQAQQAFRANSFTAASLPPPHKVNRGDTTWRYGKDAAERERYSLAPDELWYAEQLWPAHGLRPYRVTLVLELMAAGAGTAEDLAVSQITTGSVMKCEVDHV